MTAQLMTMAFVAAFCLAGAADAHASVKQSQALSGKASKAVVCVGHVVGKADAETWLDCPESQCCL